VRKAARNITHMMELNSKVPEDDPRRPPPLLTVSWWASSVRPCIVNIWLGIHPVENPVEVKLDAGFPSICAVKAPPAGEGTMNRDISVPKSERQSS
jgi:hypothetical protein